MTSIHEIFALGGKNSSLSCGPYSTDKHIAVIDISNCPVIRSVSLQSNASAVTAPDKTYDLSDGADVSALNADLSALYPSFVSAAVDGGMLTIKMVEKTVARDVRFFCTTTESSAVLSNVVVTAATPEVDVDIVLTEDDGSNTVEAYHRDHLGTLTPAEENGVTAADGTQNFTWPAGFEFETDEAQTVEIIIKGSGGNQIATTGQVEI